MSSRLLGPVDAATAIAKRVDQSWAERVCAELCGDAEASFDCRLRPGITGTASVEQIGFGAWHEWRMAWRHINLSDVAGAWLDVRSIRVAGQPLDAPLRIRIETLDAALRVLGRLGGPVPEADVDHARSVAARLHGAGALLTPATLKAASRLPAADLEVTVDVIRWLHEHRDLSEWTTRQLPVPGMHTKWLGTHGNLVRSLIGRDVTAETRPRPAVAHFTYLDPGYLATGERRHDAWTTGDRHRLAYRPRNVLVVENRDCRLAFPAFPDTIVIEGGGKAAAASLSRIDWVVAAERVVYWGDIDADGFGILDKLRAELRARGTHVDSILMDERAHTRYAHLGVDRDKDGVSLRPSTRRLPHLTDEEAACFAAIGTAGAVAFRRIEQERIPLPDAARELVRLIPPSRGRPARRLSEF